MFRIAALQQGFAVHNLHVYIHSEPTPPPPRCVEHQGTFEFQRLHSLRYIIAGLRKYVSYARLRQQIGSTSHVGQVSTTQEPHHYARPGCGPHCTQPYADRVDVLCRGANPAARSPERSRVRAAPASRAIHKAWRPSPRQPSCHRPAYRTHTCPPPRQSTS